MQGNMVYEDNLSSWYLGLLVFGFTLFHRYEKNWVMVLIVKPSFLNLVRGSSWHYRFISFNWSHWELGHQLQLSWDQALCGRLMDCRIRPSGSNDCLLVYKRLCLLHSDNVFCVNQPAWGYSSCWGWSHLKDKTGKDWAGQLPQRLCLSQMIKEENVVGRLNVGGKDPTIQSHQCRK